MLGNRSFIFQTVIIITEKFKGRNGKRKQEKCMKKENTDEKASHRETQK